jgi:hypothetical protein
LNAAFYARDQVTAFYLAQEAIEYVRNVRDNNNLLGNSGSPDWLKGLESCKAPKVCGIDVTAPIASDQVVDCSIASCNLTYNPDSGIYSLRHGSGWGSTVFTRTLQIVPFIVNSDSNSSADLTATVIWKSGRISRSITVSEKIFDWYPAPAI